MGVSLLCLRGMTESTSLSLDYEPRPWQRMCHISKARFTVLSLHRRAGKTELALMELLDCAMSCTEELGAFFYVAPHLKQAKAIAWSRLKSRVGKLVEGGAAVIQEGELSVKFPHNGAVIKIYGADNPDAMRGVRLDGVVLDEVAQMKPEVWHEIIQPALADRMGWALFIGTPQGINLFSELYYRAKASMQTPGSSWYAAKFTCQDTDALPAQEVERMRSEMSETAFAREMLCDFSAAGDDQLISLDVTETSSKRMYKAHDLTAAPRVMGVDPARFGNDRSVIMKRQGPQAFPPLVYRGVDNMRLADLVAQAIGDWHPEATFIDSGAGAGVIDRLKQLGYHVVEVPFGGRANRHTLHVNRRTEMWFEMKDWLQGGGAIPDMMSLKQELATPTYSFDSYGRRVLESKDQIKKRLQNAGSPDLADALALTFASPIQKSESRFDSAKTSSSKRNMKWDRDPYADL